MRPAMLFYVIDAVFAAAIVGIRQWRRPAASLGDAEWLFAIVFVVAWLVAWLLVLIAGRAPRGHALRPVRDPQPGLPNWDRCYIESTCGAAHSCSFVEFDERGDYLDFAQHRDAYERILTLAQAPEPLTVVLYVHG